MVTTIVLAPLIGALLCGFGWKITGDAAAQWIGTSLMLLATALAWVVYLSFDAAALPAGSDTLVLLRWVESGTLNADWAIRIDPLSTLMFVLITSVSTLVHLYAISHMARDGSFEDGESAAPRFMAYLSLLTFAALMLVGADNLLQVLFGWAGVGFVAYLLVGFAYRRPPMGAAAIKVFVFNRIGDLAFVLGIAALYLATDSLRFDDIFASLADLQTDTVAFFWGTWDAPSLIAALLLLGAVAKSAQFLLHLWLSEAADGPAPAFALIATVTTVTAGVFLLARMAPLIDLAPRVTQFAVIIGATTAIFGASVASAQTDIRRIVGYLIIAQLGLICVAIGVGSYSAAVFHLLTLGFFAPLLVLGAGALVQAMQQTSDLRKYGGLRKHMPQTFWMMIIGTLALTGVGVPVAGTGVPVGFAGFASQQAILEGYFAAHAAGFAFWVILAALAMTTFAVWRLMFLAFFGDARGKEKLSEQATETPFGMRLPLYLFSLAAVFVGMFWHAGFTGADAIIPTTDIVATVAPNWARFAPLLAMLVGVLIAYPLYQRDLDRADRLADRFAPLHRFLSQGWYVETLIEALIVRPITALARVLYEIGDRKLIDGLLSAIAGGIAPALGRAAERTQSGSLVAYALALVAGVGVLLIWVAVMGVPADG
ncbi:MAG: NADH-quinone oxidoreductase subunit L [Pseudomonadota bacterium]